MFFSSPEKIPYLRSYDTKRLVRRPVITSSCGKAFLASAVLESGSESTPCELGNFSSWLQSVETFA